MLDFDPFFKRFRPHSTLKNPIFFRALRARVFLERFPLSIAPKPDFFCALRAHLAEKPRFLFLNNFKTGISKPRFLFLNFFGQMLDPGF